jgi:hypothetical protein
MKEYIVRYENEYLQLLPDKMQELVRCKDCKHSTVSENGLIKCGHTFRTEDFFCADGERRTDDA